MKLTAEIENDVSGTVRLCAEDCRDLGVNAEDRVTVRFEKSSRVVAVFPKEDGCGLKRGCITLPKDVAESIGAEHGCEVEVERHPISESAACIQRKADGKKLTEDNLRSIVRDICDSRLSTSEILLWVASIQANRLSMKELKYYTDSICDSGKRLNGAISEKLFGYHSISGVPGNKVTPIVVSIAVAAGLKISKVPTRAISGACGTVDFMETMCNMKIDGNEFERMIEKAGGAITSDENLGICSADKILMKIQCEMGINPYSHMLASITAVNKAIGVNTLIIDIPYGRGTKIANYGGAVRLAYDFRKLGKEMGMETIPVLTDGSQPLGAAIGSNLEAREVMEILEGKVSDSDVVSKSCQIAGRMLRAAGFADGVRKAKEILASGKAWEKFREIISLQGGNAALKSEGMPSGRCSIDVKSGKAGVVHRINNRNIISIAKVAGAPADKGAGILMRKKKGDSVGVGDVLYTIYSDFDAKAAQADKISKSLNVYEIVAHRK